MVLCILFGSRARKEHDAYSDYDLLIVFENREEVLKNLEKLYEATDKTGLFIQAMPIALEEINKLNADFVKTVFEEGIVLYQRYPFATSAFAGPLKAMSIIEYRLDKLTQRKKLKLEYRLYGRKRGVIARAGGYKIGRGVTVVPRENTEIVLKALREHGAEYRVYSALMPSQGQP